MPDEIAHGVATYQQRLQTEIRGIGKVVAYLLSIEATNDVTHASDEQQKLHDVDLVWSYVVQGKEVVKTVEVKVDTKCHSTGNFVFEYVSNIITGSRGCFARTSADLMHYLALETGDLYILEVAKVRTWFEREVSRFPKRFRYDTSITQLEPGKSYQTLFYLVPIETVRKEVGLYQRRVPSL